jgi:copper chaperone NosL
MIRRIGRIGRIGLISLLPLACGGSSQPVAVDTQNDTCAWCRMVVSDVHTAAQLTAPSEEPKVFDDPGCLREYLAANPQVKKGSLAWVADHRTGAWVEARQAVYTRAPGLATAMGSHLIAHAGAASRAADPAASGGTPLTAADVFGKRLP